jgi:hypothetical protein
VLTSAALRSLQEGGGGEGGWAADTVLTQKQQAPGKLQIVVDLNTLSHQEQAEQRGCDGSRAAGQR